MSDLYKWIPKVPGVLTIALVIALGITLANLLWLIITPAPVIALAASRVDPNQVGNLARQENYGKLIADQHLFGAIPKAAPVKIKKSEPIKAVVAPTKAPIKLNLKLNGIVASKDENGGFAMISYNGKTQEIFSPGEPIPKKLPGQDTVESIGVMVTKITRDSVFIDNNGTEQILTLPSEINKPVQNTKQRTSRSSTPAPKPKIIQPKVATKAATIGTSGGIQTLAALRDQAMVNPNILMTIITPQVVKDPETGQMSGIRVYPSRNRKLFRALGLKNGDIITQVNDIVLDDQSKGLAVFQQISEWPSLELHIKRGGNDQILTPQF